MKTLLPPTRRWFHSRSASLLLAGISAPLFSSAPMADDNVVVFAGWGGPIIKSERAYYFDAFEKATGVKVIEVTDINLAKLKTMAETGNAEWDLVQALGLWLPQMVAGGSLWEPIDYSAIATDGIPEALKQKYGVGVQTFAETLAYNTNAFPAGKGPASWADLFDLKKFPGKRGMYNSPRETLEVALMSDGVLPDKLYPLDVERALKRLDQIKGDIVWWDKWPQGANLLASGEYVASMSSHDVIRELLAARFLDAALSNLESRARWRNEHRFPGYTSRRQAQDKCGEADDLDARRQESGRACESVPNRTVERQGARVAGCGNARGTPDLSFSEGRVVPARRCLLGGKFRAPD